MDHILELPDHPVFKPIIVPFIPYGIYDNLGFHHFPFRKGFTISDLRSGELRGHSATDVRRFLQAWLLFGLVSEFLGIAVDPSDFVCESEAADSIRRLSTKLLGSHLARWKDRMELTDPSEKDKSVRKIMSYIEIAGEATRSDVMSTLMGPELHLAISVLGSTLDKSRLSLRMRFAPDDEGTSSRGKYQDDDYVRFGFNTLLVDRMLANGWCPRQIHRSARDLSPSGM